MFREGSFREPTATLWRWREVQVQGDQHKLSRLTCDFSLKVLAASFAEMFAIKNRIIFPSVFWDIWYNSK